MGSIAIHDRLYGHESLIEPVLIDLLGTAAIQRLSGVLQHGITALLGITQRTSRLEHSLGVMLLVRRLGGSLDEQVAALLHDVSHTAFSHVIDYVFNDHEDQGYHERMKAAFLEDSDIPAVLAHHGYDWHRFLDDGEFGLLERPAPDLCADRLDYFLRDSLDLGLCTKSQAQQALAHLDVFRGQIVVNNQEQARWMADTFMAADEASWSNFREVALYELAARAIRLGLELGVLSDADLWSSDDAAWGRLHAAQDVELQQRLRLVSADTKFTWDAAQPTFWVRTKLRTIDPPLVSDRGIQALSMLDPVYADLRNAYLQRKAGPWPVRVIPASPQL